MVGELARRVEDPRERILLSRSARDLDDLARSQPALFAEMQRQRPVLDRVADGREQLEAALDAERRALMRQNELRLAGYEAMTHAWADAWAGVEREMEGLPLLEAHARMVARALGTLPFGPPAPAPELGHDA